MNVCFIYNPESGKGNITSYISWIEEQFIKHNHKITLYETKKEKDAYYKVLSLCGCEMILVAGGDGTLNEVVNGVMELKEKPIVSYIPTGTVNDVGHLIGMKRNVKKTIKMILKKPVIKDVDICKINDKHFVYVAAAGKFTKSSYDISRRSKKRLGVIAYYLRGSKELFKDYKMPIKVTSSKGVFEEMSSLVILLNGRRLGGLRLYRLKNKLDDGTIILRSFKRESWMFFRVLLFFFSGGIYGTRKNRRLIGTYFKIETNENVNWNIDGEFMGKGSIEVSVVPKAIKFVVNKRSIKGNFQKIKQK